MDTTQWIDNQQDIFTNLSDQIWNFAELGYHEVQSAQLLAETLETSGFTVDHCIAEIPTAFVASYGEEKFSN